MKICKYIEPREGDGRLTALPSNRLETFEFVKKQTDLFWTWDEIDLSDDRKDFEALDKKIQRFIKYTLAFFSSMDKLINENIMDIFEKAFEGIIEIQMFYDAQKHIENVHNMTYSLQIIEIIPDPDARQKLLNSIQTMETIKEQCEWVRNIKSTEYSLGEQLFRTAIVEGIMFHSKFAMIFYVQLMGKMKGLCQANSLIARDESLHRDFFVHLYNLLKSIYKITRERIIEILVEIFIILEKDNRRSLPTPICDIMNCENLTTYQKFLVDKLLIDIGVEPVYNVKNPFHFMNLLGLDTKTNTFEKKSTEYSKAGKSVNTFNVDISVDF